MDVHTHLLHNQSIGRLAGVLAVAPARTTPPEWSGDTADATERHARGV